MHPFFRRLKDRKLVQWSLAYLAGAWLLVQLSHLLGQQFGWPDAVGRGVTVLLAVGFLAALVVAWYHGEKGAQRVTTVGDLMLGGILVMAGAAVAFVGTAPAPGAAGDGAPDGPGPASSVWVLPVEEGSIAVFPFENLSGDPEQEYFSAGITDDILVPLSRIGELKVISRSLPPPVTAPFRAARSSAPSRPPSREGTRPPDTWPAPTPSWAMSSRRIPS